jgi:hypothetical protein
MCVGKVDSLDNRAIFLLPLDVKACTLLQTFGMRTSMARYDVRQTAVRLCATFAVTSF